MARSAPKTGPEAATDPPVTPAMLRRLVLRWRRDAPGSGVGAHLRRRQGHSLEFREFRLYQPGDDVRTVDWRASARLPRRSDLLVRSFEAEERLTLAIIVDNRPEMTLPASMPKLQFALWVVRALARLALDDGDDVVLARLFAGPGRAVVPLRGIGGHQQARAWSEALWQGRDRSRDDFTDLSAILSALRPAGAVVLISDMLFDDTDNRFRAFARQAQSRRRSLSVVELDTLTHEVAILRQAHEFHLLRPGVQAGSDAQLFDPTVFAQVIEEVEAHKATLRRVIHGGGLDWPRAAVTWPEPGGEEGNDNRADAQRLRDLFNNSFPHLSLLSGLGIGGRG